MTPALVMEPGVRRPRVPNRVWDRVFFTALIFILWATVLSGFSKIYFMAGMVRAPLPNLLIPVHGAAFTLWMLLLLVQTSLIMTRNVLVFVLVISAFGLVQLHRVSKATMWASLGLIVVHLTREPIGQTHLWFAMADRVLKG